MYKVPFRSIMCPTLISWIKSTIWVHLVIKLFPCSIDLASDGLLDLYKADNKEMYRQYEFMIDKASRIQLNGKI